MAESAAAVGRLTVVVAQTPGAKSTASLLSTIDEAVDSRCACGCGRELDPNGPSAWYATPGCQWQYAQRHATNPREVYDRADAMDWNIGWVPGIRVRDGIGGPVVTPRRETPTVEPAVQTVREQISNRYLFGGLKPVVRLPIPEPSGTWNLAAHTWFSIDEEWHPVGTCPLPWLRQCPQCGPVEVREVYRPTLPPTDAMDTTYPRDQVCAQCGRTFPLPLVANWREDVRLDAVALRLVAPDTTRYMTKVSNHLIDAAAAVGQTMVAQFAWRDVERALVHALTYREPCAVQLCGEKGRAYFESSRRLPLRVDVSPGRGGWATRCVPLPLGKFWLCPEHESDLLRMDDPLIGLPLLGYERLTAVP